MVNSEPCEPAGIRSTVLDFVLTVLDPAIAILVHFSTGRECASRCGLAQKDLLGGSRAIFVKGVKQTGSRFGQHEVDCKRPTFSLEHDVSILTRADKDIEYVLVAFDA